MARRGIAGGSYKPLSDEAIGRIHQTVLKVIEEVGFQVNSQEALKLFKQAGASDGDGENVIRMPSSKVMDLLAIAPAEVRWAEIKCTQVPVAPLFISMNRTRKTRDWQR